MFSRNWCTFSISSLLSTVTIKVSIRWSKVVTLMTLSFISRSLGIRIRRLSGVRNVIESKLTDSTCPSSPSQLIKSPILNDCSINSMMPLIILERLVCAAKPMAIPIISAAAKMAERSTPAVCSTTIIKRK